MNKCGSCTLCCTLFVVKELDKRAGVACDYCTNSCEIYKDRPQSCKDLQCAYIQMIEVSDLMRPDNLGVVFEKLDSDLIFGTVDPKHRDFRHMNGQINSFLKEGINVVISRNGTPVVYHLDDTDPTSVLKRVHKIVST